MICFGLKLIKWQSHWKLRKLKYSGNTTFPKRYDDGLAEAEFHDDPKSYYRQHYFEAIDWSINCIQE